MCQPMVRPPTILVVLLLGFIAGSSFCLSVVDDDADLLPYPTAQVPAGADGPLFVVSTANITEKADVVTLQTLAGVLARRSPRIYVVNSDPGKFDPTKPTSDTTVFWLSQMNKTFGAIGTGSIRFDDRSHLDGDVVGLLRRFAHNISGYVLFSSGTNSTNSALIHCAAAPGNVIAAGSPHIAAVLDSLSIPCVANLTTVTPYQALIAARGLGTLSNRMVSVQPDDGSKAQCLSAYAVLGRFPTIEDHPGGSEGFFDVLSGFASDAVSAALGWTTWDEHELVSHVTQAGGYVHASDYLYNLEVHSNLPPFPLRQRQLKPLSASSSSSDPAPKNVHTVAFMMSDGDNLQILANDFLSERLWGSPMRGDAPLGWSYSAAAATLMPVVYDYVLRTATANDSFQAGPSGAGYAYPQLFNSTIHQKSFAAATGHLMASANQSVLNVIGVTPSVDSLRELMMQPQVESCVYFTFGKANEGYSGLHGNVDYISGKPVIGARMNLWGDASRGDKVGVDALVRELATLPKDRTSPNSYSIVVVNMGSHNVSDVVAATRAMEALGGFDVVLPEVLIDRLVVHTNRAVSCPMPSGPFGTEVGDLPKCSIVGNGSCVFTCDNIRLLPLPTACNLSKCHENLTLTESKWRFRCSDGKLCPEE